jgi:CubicO group peptidase (beta-lactamase class C family)
MNPLYTNTPPFTMTADIESTYQAAIADGKINGAVICATNASGSFTYNLALGHRTLLSGEQKAQQLDDVLYLASATKLIATIAALQCVDDGLVSLTEDLTRVAPELATREVMTASDGDEPALEPPHRPVTLEMLLTHSSGLVYDFMNPLLGKWRGKYDVPEEGKPRGVEDAFRYPLAFHPGESWMYGPSLDWAGKVVERLTGQTLEERVVARICRPLGIDSAQFFPVTREELRARMVDLNPDDPKGSGKAVTGGGMDPNANSKGQFGGHSLFIAGCDYVKVLRALLANDGTILKKETVDDMFRNHLSPEAAAGHQAAIKGPMGQFFLLGVDPGVKLGFGLGGLLTEEDIDGWYGKGTLAWGGGMSFAWFVDRKNDLCGIAAPQPTMPVDVATLENLKNTFRHDIFRKKAASTAR